MRGLVQPKIPDWAGGWAGIHSAGSFSGSVNALGASLRSSGRRTV